MNICGILLGVHKRGSISVPFARLVFVVKLFLLVLICRLHAKLTYKKCVVKCGKDVIFKKFIARNYSHESSSRVCPVVILQRNCFVAHFGLSNEVTVPLINSAGRRLML